MSFGQYSSVLVGELLNPRCVQREWQKPMSLRDRLSFLIKEGAGPDFVGRFLRCHREWRVTTDGEWSDDEATPIELDGEVYDLLAER